MPLVGRAARASSCGPTRKKCWGLSACRVATVGRMVGAVHSRPVQPPAAALPTPPRCSSVTQGMFLNNNEAAGYDLMQAFTHGPCLLRFSAPHLGRPVCAQHGAVLGPESGQLGAAVQRLHQVNLGGHVAAAGQQAGPQRGAAVVWEGAEGVGCGAERVGFGWDWWGAAAPLGAARRC